MASYDSAASAATDTFPWQPTEAYHKVLVERERKQQERARKHTASLTTSTSAPGANATSLITHAQPVTAGSMPTATPAMPTEDRPSSDALRAVAELSQRTSYLVERVTDEVINPTLQNIAELHERRLTTVGHVEGYQRLGQMLSIAIEFLNSLTQNIVANVKAAAEHQAVHVVGALDSEEVDNTIRDLRERMKPLPAFPTVPAVPFWTLSTELASLELPEHLPSRTEPLRFAIEHDRPADLLDLELMAAYHDALREEFTTLLQADVERCTGDSSRDKVTREVLSKPRVADYLLARSIMTEVDIPTMLSRTVSPSLLAEVLGRELVLARSPVQEEQADYHHVLNDGPAWRAAFRATAAQAVGKQRELIAELSDMGDQSSKALDDRVLMAAIVRAIRTDPSFEPNIKPIPQPILDLILQRSPTQKNDVSKGASTSTFELQVAYPQDGQASASVHGSGYSPTNTVGTNGKRLNGSDATEGPNKKQK